MNTRQLIRTHRRRTLATAAAGAATLALSGLALNGTAQAAPGGGAPPAAGTISTIAGGTGGPAPATTVSIGTPDGVSFAGGHLYISQGLVRAVSQATGQLTTPAGAFDNTSPLGDGSPASQANVDAASTATDQAGNLVIADRFHNRIRVVAAATGTFYGIAMTAKDIYTVAGDGTAGFSGDGGPATAAELNGPNAMAVDSHGNLVVSDAENNRIRVVAAATGTFYGIAMTAGNIYTMAGTGLQRFSPNGTPAASANIPGPADLTLDAAGNVVLTGETFYSRVQVIAAATGTFYGRHMTADAIYTVAGNGNDGVTNGIPATKALIASPEGVAVDSHGNLVVVVNEFDDVRVIAATTGTFYGQAMTKGDIYTIVGGGNGRSLGDGGPALGASLALPDGDGFDSAGNLLIADSFDSRIRVVAATTGTFYGQAMTQGDIYSVAGNGNQTSSGDGGPATRAVLSPTGVAAGPDGSVFITDGDSFARLRVVAGQTGTFFGQAMTKGDVYAVAGGGDSFPGDGGPATAARVINPGGVTVDGAGNLVFTEGFGANLVQVLPVSTGTFYGQAMTAGDLYTIAGNGERFFKGDDGPAVDAQINGPTNISFDGTGNLIVTDNGNERIRVVAMSTGTFYGQAMTLGDIYTVAGDGRVQFHGNGKPATASSVFLPQDAVADAAGNLIISDTGHDRIRAVAAATGTFYGQHMTAGDMYTIAGTGAAGFSGDGGPAARAAIHAPAGLMLDAAGNVLFSDAGNGRARVIAAATGTFYGVTMTKGDMYTIAGGGADGLGDGGPAVSAELSDPVDLALDSSGRLIIADLGDIRVREVAG